MPGLPAILLAVAVCPAAGEYLRPHVAAPALNSPLALVAWGRGPSRAHGAGKVLLSGERRAAAMRPLRGGASAAAAGNAQVSL